MWEPSAEPGGWHGESGWQAGTGQGDGVAKAQKPGLYGDGAGLGLRISVNGAASWVLRYMRQGKAREMGLGALHTFGLAEAREKARRFRQELHDGIDPLAAQPPRPRPSLP